ncbi:hypothetical protein R3P38DRAFT_3240528 [Favolaschia claudopus]|uniref:F-box domain-containing protein n=1 Tax=Favolaschia claudopus TaxID=2862362 RepID=A0AAV9Z6V2_9AGAR
MCSSLPIETLQAIQKETIALDTNWVDIVDQRRTLCLVSHFWKDAADQCVALWTSIDIQRFTTPKLLRRCLSCCPDESSTSITIDLASPTHVNKAGKEETVNCVSIETLLEMLTRHLASASNKVVKVQIVNGPESHVRRLGDWFALHRWPRLQSLALKPMWSDMADVGELSFPHTHNIASLEIDGISLLSVPRSLRRALRELTLRGSSSAAWIGFWNAMSEASSLEQLVLDRVSIPHSNSMQFAQLNALRRLHVYCEHPTEADVVTGLDVSALDLLQVRALRDASIQDVVLANATIFARSKSVVLLQRYDVGGPVLAALRVMRDVSHLNIGYCGAEGADALAEFVVEGGCLRSLQEVQCGGIFNEALMEVIAGGQFASDFTIVQQGRTVRGRPLK